MTSGAFQRRMVRITIKERESLGKYRAFWATEGLFIWIADGLLHPHPRLRAFIR